MVEILIFLTIASIIVNIIKAVGGAKTPQIRGANGETPPDPQGINPQQPSAEKTGPKYTIRMGSPDVGRPVVTEGGLKSDPPNTARRGKQRQIVPRTQPHTKGMFDKLTRDRLIEGIILSEILAAPKSKRRGIS